MSTNYFDQARANADYWRQWETQNNVSVQGCLMCNPLRPHLRDQKQCLDCHGHLQEIASYVFRCESCKVIHGMSGGNSSPYARYHRSGLLKFERGNIEYDFSATCVLSQSPRFQKWLRSSRRRS